MKYNIQTPSVLKLIFSKRMLIIFIMGFASGLPCALIGTTLQAWYAVEGVSLVTIGLLALVGQPYIYKFLWAPAVDQYQPLKIGRRRSWILITQVLLIGCFLMMACFQPSTAPMTLALLALVLAFLSATQDIAIDAYKIEILSQEDRGFGVAMGVAGYRVAMLVSGGLALVLAEYIGFQLTFIWMSVCMGISMIATLWMDEAPSPKTSASFDFKKACIIPFVAFFEKKHAWAFLLLIVLYKLGDAFAGSLSTPFLLRGLGFSLADVGFINKTLGLCGTLVGVFCGGMLLRRTTLLRALFGFGIIQALSNLTYIGLLWTDLNYSLMAAAVFLENFGGGLGTVAFLALLMSLCDKRYTATQFALLSALSAVGRVYIGSVSGFLVETFGWSEFFLWSIALSLPSLCLLYWLREEINPPLVIAQ